MHNSCWGEERDRCEIRLGFGVGAEVDGVGFCVEYSDGGTRTVIGIRERGANLVHLKLKGKKGNIDEDHHS